MRNFQKWECQQIWILEEELSKGYVSLYFTKDSSTTKENNDPIANVARAVSFTAETDRAQDVLFEVVFDSNVAPAVSSTAKKDHNKKKPRSKRSKKITQDVLLSDSDDNEH